MTFGIPRWAMVDCGCGFPECKRQDPPVFEIVFCVLMTVGYIVWRNLWRCV